MIQLRKEKTLDALGSYLWRIAVLLSLCLIIFAGTGVTSVFAASDTASANSGSTYTGWKKIKGKKYYYVKGTRVKGWKKISGKYYYFNKKGQMQKNKIVGTKKSGYYYVDKSGVRVTTKEMKLAVKFVLKHSNSSKSRAKRLKQCFNALRKYSYKRYYGDNPKASKMAGYARDMFKNKKGNCYRYACAMAYIAKALGYEVRVAVGGVSAGSSHLSAHGWCEVKIGSKWRILDCSMQNHHTSAKMYLVTRSNYPYPIRCDKVYYLKVNKGKVKWK